MTPELVPINRFVLQKYQTPMVQKIVESWRLEPQVVIEKLVEHFREMGIFAVSFQHERLITASIVHHLKHSPDIARLVLRARNEELRKQRNRHAV
jgi:hypothetical protein